MSDRLSSRNGKRHTLWGTLRTCPACGRCLCYGCHPQGPCIDEREGALRRPLAAASMEREAPAGSA
jgi:hypothetical protein